jgi:hypothetical protein
MDARCKSIIWGQFGAAIDALENAIVACPEDLWFDSARRMQYWYLVSHTLFWLDYYLTDPRVEFSPPEPIGLEELDPAGVMPPRAYTKDELLAYLEFGRNKCRTTIMGLTDELAEVRKDFGKLSLRFGELLLYNMRHVQHGVAQLNLVLRETIDSAPKWTFTAKER